MKQLSALGIVYNQWKQNIVYDITFPPQTQIKFYQEGRDAYDFYFAHRLYGQTKYEYSKVTLSEDLYEVSPPLDITVIACRAMFKILGTESREIGFASGDGPSLLTSDQPLRNDRLRFQILSYIHGRYDLLWHKSFILLEILGAIRENHIEILRNIIYLANQDYFILPDRLNQQHFLDNSEQYLGMELNLHKGSLQAIRSYLSEYRVRQGIGMAEATPEENRPAKEYDAFLCHASEDKEAFVRPLARRLAELGYKIWYDEFCLKMGDSLRQSIDSGLIRSRHGIVVLSRAFFGKEWANKELSALFQQEIDKAKLILPVWYGIDRADVVKNIPLLADKVAAKTSGELDPVIEMISERLAEK